MSQIESAVPTKLDLVGHHLNGHKLRVAGKVLCYDPTSALLLLVDKETALLIDVSLCVDRWSGPWLRERLATAMVMGHIEILEKQLPIPTLPAFAPAPSVDPQVVLRAVLVVHTPELDLALWNDSMDGGDDALVTSTHHPSESLRYD
ncbi:hypothetical protein EYR40_006507 [Pleurotus pulmonarius]|nr:hypothetical protein EYR36_011126 [Pleurotus pulmonarius]KAF4599413.1 hypothetical protein EYR40_006507 [Pleurotus pulmonarius]